MVENSTPCVMCKLLKESGDFIGSNCLSCGAQLRDPEDNIEELDRCEEWLSKYKYEFVERGLAITDAYRTLRDDKYKLHTQFACDIYLCEPQAKKADIYKMYTLREICKIYEIDKGIVQMLREKVTRPTVYNKDYRHTVYRLFRTGHGLSKGIVVCPDVISEYLRIKSYSLCD